MFEPVMMMLLSWQEQEAANDIGVTSFTFLLINRGVGGGRLTAKVPKASMLGRKNTHFCSVSRFFRVRVGTSS